MWDIKKEIIEKEILKDYPNLAYDYIDDFYAKGKLSQMINQLGLVDDLNSSLFYLSLVLSRKEDLFYNSKVDILMSEFLKIYDDYELQYMLCLHLFGNDEAYRVFPKFLYLCAKKFNIDIYNKMPYEKLKEYLDDMLELTYSNYRGWERELCTFPSNDRINEKKYNDYFKAKENNNLILTYDNFFIWGEEKIYNEQLNIMRRIGKEVPEEHVKWLGLNNGDYYGCDILTNPRVNKENLIEVKTGESNNITMTVHEYDIAKQTTRINNCDYFLQRFKYGSSNGKPDFNKINRENLIMDKEYNVFINIDNPNIMYIGALRKVFNQNGELIDIVDLYTPEEYNSHSNKDAIRLIDTKEVDKLKTLGKII